MRAVAYLIYMALMTLKENGPLQIDEKSETRSTLKIIVSAILLNLLNPKLPIFFLAFLPQFVDMNEPTPCRAYARPERHIHVDDVYGLCAVRHICSIHAYSHVLSTPRISADADYLCKWLRWSCRETCSESSIGAVTLPVGLSNKSSRS